MASPSDGDRAAPRAAAGSRRMNRTALNPTTGATYRRRTAHPAISAREPRRRLPPCDQVPRTQCREPPIPPRPGAHCRLSDRLAWLSRHRRPRRRLRVDSATETVAQSTQTGRIEAGPADGHQPPMCPSNDGSGSHSVSTEPPKPWVSRHGPARGAVCVVPATRIGGSVDNVRQRGGGGWGTACGGWGGGAGERTRRARSGSETLQARDGFFEHLVSLAEREAHERSAGVDVVVEDDIGYRNHAATLRK